MLHVCPTDVVRAPAERVWSLIATPTDLARWTGTTIIDGPDRQLRAGDRLVLCPGVSRRVQIVFAVQEVVPPRRLAVHVTLPFGVTNEQVTEISSIGSDACRVTFN